MNGQSQTRKGFTIVYVVILMTVLLGFVSFAADFGRVQVAKTQLLVAADAAARAGASQLSTSIVATQNAAVLWAGYNSADGSSVVVNPTNDVIFGTWDPVGKTFTTLTGTARSGANAIMVNTYRTAAAGDGIPLLFAGIIGQSTCDIHESAIAYAPAAAGMYEILGLTQLHFSAAVSTDSYNATSGTYSAATAGSSGLIASNGGVTLSSGTINSNVYMMSGQTLSAGTSSYGTRTNNTSAIVWPTPTAGSYATSNDNANLGLPTSGATASFSSGTFDVPAGNYYINSFSMSGGQLNFTGPTTLYMNGSVSISGGTLHINSGHPGDLTIKMCAASSFTVSGGADVSADLQAPTSTIAFSGTSNFYGRLIGSKITISAPMKIHVDTSLPAVTGASTATTGSTSGIESVK